MRWLLTFPEDRPSVAFYREWVTRGGVDPTILRAADAVPSELSDYAALLLPGGGDVEPALYGASRHPRTYGVDTEQDQREVALLDAFRALRRPIFGICRGLQMINVALGGELLQHIPDVVPERIERHRKQGEYDVRHPLSWDTETRLGWRLRLAADVNSAHHQSIRPETVGRGLRVAARSPQGIIEAVECFTGPSPIVAVQWHPERLPADHPASAELLALFVDLARAR